MADSMMYFLVQWQDRFISIISPKDIISPKLEIKDYKEGDHIEASFNKKPYKAVISEIHPNRKYLKQQTKFPLKHSYFQPKDTQNNDDDTLAVIVNEQNTMITDQSTNGDGTLAVIVNEQNAMITDQSTKEGDGTLAVIVNEQSTMITDQSTKEDPVSSSHKSSTNSIQDELKEDVRYLRRKVRKLEDRIINLEKVKAMSPEDSKLAMVDHLSESDEQQVLTTLAFKIFTKDELINSSRTGKRTGKCTGNPRPPLAISKLDELERLVRKKTKMSKERFCKKFENLQKTLRQKEQKVEICK